ncbi:MAG TPA: porin [Candidatus Desulfobacillus sp.]|nr:porin [Candidatus Desulfobacillus sp.]
MQKKLIVAAVAGLLAAPVMAQTNVTISGNWFIGWENNKTTNTNAGTVNRVQDQSSAIIFSGTEDLGGGLKAWWQIDSRFGPDQGAGGNWSSGNTMGGLMGTWGKIGMGRWDLHYQEFAGGLGAPRARSLQTLLGHGIMSEVNGVAISPRTRSQNVLKYDTPNINGFNGTLAYSTNPFGAEGPQNNNGSKGGAWTGALRYANGPMNAGISYWRNNEEGGNGATGAATASNQRSTRVWGRYTFGMGLSVGLGWDSSKYDADITTGTNWVKRNAWLLPVSYAFGPHQVYFQFAKANKTSGAANNSNTGGKAYLLGYDYALSKRTLLGAYYTKVTNQSRATYDFFATPVNTNNGENARQIYIGMAHMF